MALLRVDWNPSPRKIREFGIGIVVFFGLLGGLAFWKGHADRARAFWTWGSALGVLVLAAPGGPGRWVYKAWMSVAFVIGTTVSTVMLGAVYYLAVTPLAFAFRLSGRDALRLKRPAGDSYWVPLESHEKAYFERLY